MKSLFKPLVKEQLSSVEFVQDYLQLHFDGYTLTYYVWPEIIIDDKKFSIGSVGYRDAMCNIIAHILTNVEFVDQQELCLQFDNNNQIYLSLIRNEQNSDVKEFVYYRGLNGDWFVLD